MTDNSKGVIANLTMAGRAREAIDLWTKTEQIFIEKLLREMIGEKGLIIEARKAHGGRRYPRSTYLVRSPPPNQDARYFALIVDCGTDSRVTSDSRPRYGSLRRDHGDIFGDCGSATQWRSNRSPASVSRKREYSRWRSETFGKLASDLAKAGVKGPLRN